MLIDLLDKKALEEDNLESLNSSIYNLAASGEADKIIQVLNTITTTANNIRNYDLLIYEAKRNIKVKLSEQEFDLNALDIITDAIKISLRALDTAINNSDRLELVVLLNSRTSLQVELNTINKASDEAMWRVELANG